MVCSCKTARRNVRVCVCLCVFHTIPSRFFHSLKMSSEKRGNLFLKIFHVTYRETHSENFERNDDLFLEIFFQKSHTCVFLADSSFPELQMSTQSQTYNIFGDEKLMYYVGGSFVNSPQLDLVFYGSSPPLCCCKRALINPRCASMRSFLIFLWFYTDETAKMYCMNVWRITYALGCTLVAKMQRTFSACRMYVYICTQTRTHNHTLPYTYTYAYTCKHTHSLADRMSLILRRIQNYHIIIRLHFCSFTFGTDLIFQYLKYASKPSACTVRYILLIIVLVYPSFARTESGFTSGSMRGPHMMS